jgi:hypothetical protein
MDQGADSFGMLIDEPSCRIPFSIPDLVMAVLGRVYSIDAWN